MDTVQVFEPTMEEFHHFDRYIHYMENRGAHLAGIAKVSNQCCFILHLFMIVKKECSSLINVVWFHSMQVIPPREWKCRNSPYDISNIRFPPVHQVLTQLGPESEGFYQQALVFDTAVTAEEFKQLSKRCPPPNCTNFDELDNHYWEQIEEAPRLYGSDVDGTFFDDSCDIWNLNKLQSILNDIEEDYELVMIPGFVFLERF